jgi:3',5'-nucleoside bisphosphate phosphatase
MGGRADLHIHTHFSDGGLSPRDVIARSRASGLSTIAITDHDHTGGIAEALSAGARAGIEVIPGIELSAMLNGAEIHILGYFINPEHEALQEFLYRVREERRKRAVRMVEKLNGLNLPLPLEAVLDQAGEGSIGRPHIANAMVEQGLAASYQEAFYRYLGTGRPAYEEKFPVSPADTIQVIRATGGLSFIAHPGTAMEDHVLLECIRAGVDGIEVVHPAHSQDLVHHYRGIVEEYFLLASGGSDFHGGRRNDDQALGKYTVPREFVEAMRRRLG